MLKKVGKMRIKRILDSFYDFCLTDERAAHVFLFRLNTRMPLTVILRMKATDEFPRGAESQWQFNAISENVENGKLGSLLQAPPLPFVWSNKRNLHKQ